jgi:hypothetical protein
MANAYTEKATETFRMVVSMLGGFGSVPDQPWTIGAGSANTATTTASKVNVWNGLNAPSATYLITAGFQADGTGDGCGLTSTGLARSGSSTNLPLNLLTKGTAAFQLGGSSHTNNTTGIDNGIIGGSSNTISGSGARSYIIGGSGNTISGTNQNQIVIGGGSITISSTGASCFVANGGGSISGAAALATIIGGNGNSISSASGGSRHGIWSSASSTINSTGNNCSIIGGQLNTINAGTGNIILGGSSSVINATALGYTKSNILVHGNTAATHNVDGEYVHGGDSSHSYCRTLHRWIANGTGSTQQNAGNVFVVPNNMVAAVTLTFVARDSGAGLTKHCHIKRMFLFYCSSNTVTQIGTAQTIGTDINPDGYTVTITPSGATLPIFATGVSGGTATTLTIMEVALNG